MSDMISSKKFVNERLAPGNIAIIGGLSHDTGHVWVYSTYDSCDLSSDLKGSVHHGEVVLIIKLAPLVNRGIDKHMRWAQCLTSIGCHWIHIDFNDDVILAQT